MAKYVTLFNWTEQGIKNFRDSADRVSTAEEAFGALGGRIVDMAGWQTRHGRVRLQTNREKNEA